MDTQIWYVIFSTLYGGIYEAFRRLGEIQTLGLPCLVVTSSSHIKRNKLQDLLNCGMQLLQVSKRKIILTIDTELDLIQWPLFLLASKIPIALDMAKENNDRDRELEKRIENDIYMCCAVIECYSSFRYVIKFLVCGSRKKKVINEIFEEVDKHIENDNLVRDSNMSALPILFDHVVKLIKYLTINKAKDHDEVIIIFLDMHEVVTRYIMEDHLLKIGKWKEEMNESAMDVPSNLEARRQISFFSNSLFMDITGAGYKAPDVSGDAQLLVSKDIDQFGTDSPDLRSLVCLRTCLEPDEWIKDSGCSKHMTGNKSLFSTYKAYDGGNVVFGSNLKGKIIGKGTISNDSLTISNVEHVDNLAFNLLSVGQICDNKCQVLFTEEGSEIIKDGKIIGNGIRKNGLYVMKLGNKSQDKLCLATVVDNSTLWHRRLGHANMRLIQSLSSKELVRNLPKLKYDKHFCDACKIGKQAHASHKAKNMVSTKRCLELLHMDLFGPSAIKSYGGNLYTLVVVDDYSRYTWTRFLKTKNEAFEKFEILSRKIQNQLGSSIIAIRTDHGREFDNEVQFGAYCDAQGITHNFSAPRTPQSNGVVERKNRTLQEMSRTMLNEQFIP
ncbi:retrovirus-related pol polyprotein from transposon TNT 1-94 [Tanacetum coccineum]